MKYFVIAAYWDSNKKMQVNYIAGEFNEFSNANIFKEAYNFKYKANACIVNSEELINTSKRANCMSQI